VDRFLNYRCIIEGFQSEEDYFGSDIGLGQWLRDARRWATGLLGEEPEKCGAMFEASAEPALEAVRELFRTEVGPQPEEVDDLDATAQLVRWAKRRRGFEYSSYRAQLWEFVVEIVDAALWLGWLSQEARQVSRTFKTQQQRKTNRSKRKPTSFETPDHEDTKVQWHRLRIPSAVLPGSG
jgi:hypothetical protein